MHLTVVELEWHSLMNLLGIHRSVGVYVCVCRGGAHPCVVGCRSLSGLSRHVNLDNAGVERCSLCTTGLPLIPATDHSATGPSLNIHGYSPCCRGTLP